MTTPLARYHNPGTTPIEVKIGEAPGEAPTVYKCLPGQSVEGPANYAEAFARGGLFTEERLAQRKKAKPKAEKLAEPKAEKPAEKPKAASKTLKIEMPTIDTATAAPAPAPIKAVPTPHHDKADKGG